MGEFQTNLQVAEGCATVEVEDRVDKWWMVESVMVEQKIASTHGVNWRWDAPGVTPRPVVLQVYKKWAMWATGRLKRGS